MIEHGTTDAAAEQRVLLRSVSWDVYQSLVEESEHAAGRMTYDRGVMELMSPSKAHEHAGALLARMVEQFSLIRNIEIHTVKSTTFRRRDLGRGFEADEAYYIQHAAQVRTRSEIDLSIDPPPDLVIEIDISRSSIEKLPLLAAMGVPEVWRYDGERLFCGFISEESYRQVAESHVLPGFPLVAAEQILSRRTETSETALIRQFVQRISIDKQGS